jgi:hypothetical protein
VDKAELLQRLNQAHREILLLVQGFSQQDFDRKAPAASWSAKDVFAHLARTNRLMLRTIEAMNSGPVFAAPPAPPDCTEIPTDGGGLSLAKTMDEFRVSQRAIVTMLGRAGTEQVAKSAGYLNFIVRHYQIHQNDLKVLAGSFRPH